MRRFASLVVVAGTAGAACLSRPSAVAGDGGGGPDAPCIPSLEWSATAVPIDIAMPTTDAATSPWLSDDGTDLWFTELAGGDPGEPTIMHATRSALGWSTPEPVTIQGGGLDDNPFVDEAGPTLWFDNRADVTSSRSIVEVALQDGVVTGVPTVHGELLAAKEPSLSVNGMSIYFQRDGSASPGLQRADRFAMGSAFTSFFGLSANSDPLESPSVSADATTIYFSDYTNSEHVASGTLNVGTITAIGSAGPFEAGSGIYFDPNISRDGNTLVFAARIDGVQHARLYSVTHTCM